MPDQSNFTNNPLAALALLMAAYTPDPAGQLNNLSSSINSIKEAVNQINSGLSMFNTEVMPMFMNAPKNTDQEQK